MSDASGNVYVVTSQPDFVRNVSVPIFFFEDYPTALAFAKSIFRKFSRPTDPRDMVFMVKPGPVVVAATTPAVPITPPTTKPLTTS